MNDFSFDEYEKISNEHWFKQRAYLESLLVSAEHKLSVLEKRLVNIPKEIETQKKYIDSYLNRIERLDKIKERMSDKE